MHTSILGELAILLASVADGNTAASQTLIERTQKSFEALVRKLLRKQYPTLRKYEETGDVLQSWLFKLITKWEKTIRDPDGQPVLEPQVYLARVTRLLHQTFIEMIRDHEGRADAVNKRPKVVSIDKSADSSSDAPALQIGTDSGNPEMIAYFTAFHQAVQELPPDQRQAVELHYYQDWTMSQIAEVAGVTEHAVYKRWYKGQGALISKFGGSPFGV